MRRAKVESLFDERVNEPSLQLHVRVSKEYGVYGVAYLKEKIIKKNNNIKA